MGDGTWDFVGQPVRQEDLDLIRSVLGDFAGLSREELAATVCEWLGWTRATGRLKARECREWLERLETARLITLPPKRVGRPLGSRTQVPVTGRGEAQPVLTGTVRDVAPIAIERVTTADQRRLFRELVGRYHYLGHAVPFGGQLRYLVYASTPQRQVVGCVQFSSPAWRMAARDRWIGWDDRTRARQLPHIVNNSRLLILPWVRVKNLASTILSQTARAVRVDWRQVYGVTPVLLETLVDPARFDGASYRAANWIVVGTTSGRGRDDRDRRAVRVPKRVLLYPLVRDAAQQLRGQ
ncbi:MAG: Druantia anti-phage system protein DruA [Solirubrobacteraceae bacterium]